MSQSDGRTDSTRAHAEVSLNCACGSLSADSPRAQAEVSLNSACGSLHKVQGPVQSVGWPAEADVDKSGIVGPRPVVKKTSMLKRRRLSMKSPEVEAERPAAALPSLLKRRAQTRQAHRPEPSLNMSKIAIEKAGVAFEEDLWKGQYQIIETTARTAASKVQRAIRVSDKKEVALKTTWSNELQILNMATEEFRALQRMDHGNIIQALDLRVVGGRAVMAMDYFDGPPLDHAVRHHPHHFSEAQSRGYAGQLFEAIGHVHAQGMIHRDIKPQNTLVSLERKTLMLIDFNTACDWSQEDVAVAPAGTELYMAPEELRGNPSSPAGDVWGAALCVFLMIAGKLPQGRHRCEHREALEFAAEQVVKFEGKTWGKVSEPCKNCLSRCLAVDEHARPKASVALNLWILPWSEHCDAGVTVKAQPSGEHTPSTTCTPSDNSQDERDLEGDVSESFWGKPSPLESESSIRNSFALSGYSLGVDTLPAAVLSFKDPRAMSSDANDIDERSTTDIERLSASLVSDRTTERFTEDRLTEDQDDKCLEFGWSRFDQAIVFTEGRNPVSVVRRLFRRVASIGQRRWLRQQRGLHVAVDRHTRSKCTLGLKSLPPNCME